LSRNHPINAIQIPPPKLPVNICQMPANISMNAKNRPTFAAMRVARRIFPVIAHTIARNTRPPSSGYPGIKLKSTKARLM